MTSERRTSERRTSKRGFSKRGFSEPVFREPRVEPRRSFAGQGGFTLLEILVAFAILAIALTSMLGLRSASISRAMEGRNIRVATTLARQILSELRAGQFDVYEVQGQEEAIKGFEDFSYRILLGEGSIAQAEESALELQSENEEAVNKQRDRLSWLNSRRQSRERSALAKTRGVSRQQVKDSEVEDNEVTEPSSFDEDNYEEVAVAIRYPSPSSSSGWAELILRTRASTLALSGQLPEDTATSSTATSSMGNKASR